MSGISVSDKKESKKIAELAKRLRTKPKPGEDGIEKEKAKDFINKISTVYYKESCGPGLGEDRYKKVWKEFKDAMREPDLNIAFEKITGSIFKALERINDEIIDVDEDSNPSKKTIRHNRVLNESKSYFESILADDEALMKIVEIIQY